jgi:hypothetical protein
MKYLVALVTALLASASALATNIPGESAYCLANCINGYCIPINATLGEKNVGIGVPLFVPVRGPLGTILVLAISYSWGWDSGPHGTPTNLTGIGTDNGNSYTIPQVTMSDSGLYTQIGYSPPATASQGSGSESLNWCITVNPIAVLNNNLKH